MEVRGENYGFVPTLEANLKQITGQVPEGLVHNVSCAFGEKNRFGLEMVPKIKVNDWKIGS